MIIFILILKICTAESRITADVTPGNNEALMLSTHQLTELLKTEVEFAQELQAYLGLLQDEVRKVQGFIDTNYSDAFRKLSDFEKYASNPINAFGVMKRMNQGYLEGFWNESIDKKRQQIKKLLTHSPPFEDYLVTASSLALIQESYNLKTSDLNQGLIKIGPKSLQSEFQFDVQEQMNIGLEALSRKWYDSGIEWLHLALNGTNGDDSAIKKLLKSHIKQAYQAHDHMLEKHGPISLLHRSYPRPFDPKLRKKKKYKKVPKTLENKIQKNIVPFYNINAEKINNHYEGNFHALCQDSPEIKPNQVV